MMKKLGMFTLCICITVLCAATLGFAQAPQILNFQGRLNDSSGNPVTDGNYSIQFLIYPVASGGTAVWNQTQAVTTQNGVFNVLLNDVTLDLTAAEYYLAMKVGSDSEMTPRQRIASVPYALNANTWLQNGDNIYFEGGKVGIGTANPSQALDVFGNIKLLSGDGSEGKIGGSDWDGGNFVIEAYKKHLTLFTWSPSGRIRFTNNEGFEKVSILNSGNVGIGTISPSYTLDVNGTLHVRGQDIAEPFEMTDLDTLELGDVVVIDPQNPLHVTKSTQTYDTTVAGIVSSDEQAGYVAGSRSDGTSDKPIALVGRVLCKVSGENGPIQIGDLLTTAKTPGYAMKATDFERRQGAILGKALQAFEEQTGTIMVLVTLQ